MNDFSDLNKKIEEIISWLNQEFGRLRTGRATPMILESLDIEAYGTKMSIQELASVIIEDAKTIKIEPWDTSVLKTIEKSIITSNLGLSVAPFDKGIRIIFPELTSERREEITKSAKQKLEEARISLRNLRDKKWNEIQEKEKRGEVSEDEKFKLKEKMQEMVDGANKKLEELFEKKETEIKNK